jgi:uncharacterized protein (TIGR03084 family)
MPTMEDICRDVAAETDDVLGMVEGLEEAGWNTATPAEGWMVRDQISHLAYFDDVAAQAVTDPDGFKGHAARAADDPDTITAGPVERGRSMSGAELLEWFRSSRARMLDVFRGLDPRDRIPWYGPAMSAASFATARLMETWAHGQDVADALGVERQPTDRLRHVCHIGVRALPFTYTIRNLPLPTDPVRVELRAPSGATWTWGEERAANVVRGDALDFALVVTQRRHRDDTDLEVRGPVAEQWISVAQAFAGPPGAGRQPGQFPKPANGVSA